MTTDISLLSVLLRSCGMSAVRLDRHGIVRMVHGELFEKIGISEKTSLDKPMDEGLAPLAHMLPHFRKALEGVSAQRIYPYENRLLEIHLEPLLDPNGHVDGVLAFDVDVTDNVRLKRLQQEQETQLENLFNNSSDGIMLLDRNMVIKRANPYVDKVHADVYPLEGHVCHERFFGNDAPCPHCPVIETLKTGQPAHSSCYDPKLKKHLQLSSTPLFDKETGELIGAFEVFRDITDNVRNLEKVKTQESLVADVFSSIREGMFVIDRDFNILRANPTFENHLVPPHLRPAVGKKCYATANHSEVCEYCPAVRTFENGEVGHVIHSEQISETRKIWVDHSSYPILSSSGIPEAAICVVRDITKRVEDEESLDRYRNHLEEMIQERTAELYRSESRMRAILSHSITPTFFIDTRQCLTFANGAFQDLIGYSESELVGKNVSLVYDMEHLSQTDCLENRRRAFAGEINDYRTETPLRHKNGNLLWVDMNASVVRDSEGRVTQIIAVTLDITERRQMMEELEKARLAAEEASIAKSQFLATMSHEIRTPLNGVIGLSDLLLGTDLNVKQYEYAQLIKASGKSLLFLINDILDFSKIEAGKLELDCEVFDLPSMVESVLGILSSRVADKNLEICTTFSYGLPRAVCGDSGRIRQILLNLVGNAVKFTETGGVRIDTIFERFRGDHAVIRFAVIDSGIGIPEDRIDRLFKTFSQADASSARVYGGTGLGLAISLRLVRLREGEIGVESVPGKGSTFWFRIPLRCAPAMVDCLTRKQKECIRIASESCPITQGSFCVGLNHRGRNKGFKVEGIRVLVAEDNVVHRGALCKQLTVWGMKPMPVDSMQKIWDCLDAEDDPERTDAVHLVLIDKTLSDGDGIELARQIGRMPISRRPGMILLLPLAEQMDEELVDSLGIDHVSKPVFASALFDAIMNQLFGNKDESGIMTPFPLTQSETRTHVQQQLLETSKRQSNLDETIHILIAEDNRINQIVIKNILLEAGFTCQIVSNGHEACHELTQNDYHIVLMDCQMPEMDGYEATDLIRKWEMEQGHRRIPIIALTANATKGDEEKCLAAGMDAYCSKPVDPRNIVRLIENWYRKGKE